MSYSVQQGLQNESANQVLAGPTSGAAAKPTFRALVAADMPIGGVNSQTANYPAVAGDYSKLITMNGSSLTLTLPNPAPSAVWHIAVENTNASSLTISRNSLTIDGAASNLTLTQNQGVWIFTDGTNYFTSRGMAAAGGGGTVTSVAMTGDGVIFNSTVSGSPITTSGTLAPALLTQTANTILAGPTTGAASAPTFRALVAADIPSAFINNPMTTLGDTIYENATPAPARLAGNTTSTKNFLTQTGTGSVSAAPAWGTIAAADVPIMIGDSGSGGTRGEVPAPGAGDAAAGKFLKADATWAVPAGSGSLSVSGFYITDGTNYYIGPTTFLCTRPSAGNYSWVNQGSATETATGGGLVLAIPVATTSDSFHIRTKSISTKTTLIAALIAQGSSDGSHNPSFAGGIGFRESGTGKLLILSLQNTGTSAAPSTQIAVFSFTNPTTFNATRATWIPWVAQVQFFKIVYDGTNTTLSVSPDGLTFTQIYQAAKATNFTTAPDQWFYTVNNSGNTTSGTTTLLSWTES